MDESESKLVERLMRSIMVNDDMKDALLETALGYKPEETVQVCKISDANRRFGRTVVATVCLPESSCVDGRISNAAAMAVFYWLCKNNEFMAKSHESQVADIEEVFLHGRG